MLGPSRVVNSIDFLMTLIRDINADNGTNNCGHCALRLDHYLREGQHLKLGAVPIDSAGIHFFPQFKNQKLFRTYTNDERLLKRCLPDGQPAIRAFCNLESEHPEFLLDISEDNTSEQLKLFRTSSAEIIETLQQQPRRKKDNTAFGFIVLTHTDNAAKGHIINFYVASDNRVYFLDAQAKMADAQIRLSLNMQGFRDEVFYVPSYPPEGFRPKPVKQEQKIAITRLDPKVMEAYRLVHLVNIPFSFAPTDLNNTQRWLEMGRTYNNAAISVHAPKSPLFYELATLCNEQNGEAWAELVEFRLPNWQEHAIKAYGYGCPATKAYILEKLISHATEMVKDDPNSADTWSQLGCRLLNTHRTLDLLEAYKCFRYALMLKPKDDKVWKRLSECHKRGLGNSNDAALAIACLDNYHRRILRQRVIALDLPQVAAPTLFQIIKPSAPILTADLLKRIPESDSTTPLKGMIASHGTSELWLRLGQACNPKSEERYLCYVKATEDSNHGAAWGFLAAYRRTGWPLHLMKAYGLGFKNVRTCLGMGLIHIHQNPGLSAHYIKEGLKQDPSVGIGWFLLGMLYLKTNNHLEGYCCLRHALFLDPKHMDTWTEIANYLQEFNKPLDKPLIEICLRNVENLKKHQPLLNPMFDPIQPPAFLQEIQCPVPESKAIPAPVVFSELAANKSSESRKPPLQPQRDSVDPKRLKGMGN